MKTITATELRSNIYNLLDEVLASGIPIEIRKGQGRLRIIRVERIDKLQNLAKRHDVIQGDPEALVDVSWDDEVRLDLP